MSCPYEKMCGGCLFRELREEEYRRQKIATFEKIISNINQKEIAFGEPVFIGDGARRRAEFSFDCKRGKIILGYNQRQTHEIVDISACLLLCEKINQLLPKLRDFLSELCSISITKKEKGGKRRNISVQKGQIFLTSCANGVDISLETAENPEFDHRMLVADLVNNNSEIIRFSWKNAKGFSETIVQKSSPFINIADYQIKIPSATFLQASEESEKVLIDLVQKYIGDLSGNIADLFCGIGTFSYPLARNIKNKITAVDSSKELLAEFQKNVNSNEIPNIKIIERNLFKYPLDGEELKGFSAVVFDPPRAGAVAQTKALAELKYEEKPQKIVAVSCNPHTFVNDANVLLSGGYNIKEVTPVDQFAYSNHMELVSLFEKR